tara:strand:+ start:88 stop:771 length:684 start_codon:yes stop_codon:yes gene_type:complete
MDMLNEFLNENYSNEKSVQLCRWKKRLNKPIEELKGADRTLIKLFNFCNDLYEENKKLKNLKNENHENQNIISEVKPPNHYIGIRNNNERIDTNNIIVGKKLKTIKPKPKMEKENVEPEKEYYMEGDIKVITCIENHNIEDFVKIMRGTYKAIIKEVKLRKLENKTKNNIENYVEKNSEKMVFDRYDMICKGSNVKLNDELYEYLIIGIIKKIKSSCKKLLENYCQN